MGQRLEEIVQVKSGQPFGLFSSDDDGSREDDSKQYDLPFPDGLPQEDRDGQKPLFIETGYLAEGFGGTYATASQRRYQRVN